MEKVCDGEPDCSNGMDEKNCGTYSFLKFLLDGYQPKFKGQLASF